jgi:hypothetical protein
MSKTCKVRLDAAAVKQATKSNDARPASTAQSHMLCFTWRLSPRVQGSTTAVIWSSRVPCEISPANDLYLSAQSSKQPVPALLRDFTLHLEASQYAFTALESTILLVANLEVAVLISRR